MGDNRVCRLKRDRENDDFTPISKRMRSIHINEQDVKSADETVSKQHKMADAAAPSVFYQGNQMGEPSSSASSSAAATTSIAAEADYLQLQQQQQQCELQQHQRHLEMMRSNASCLPMLHDPTAHQQALLVEQEEFRRLHEGRDLISTPCPAPSGVIHKSQTSMYLPIFGDSSHNQHYYEINRQLFYAHQHAQKRNQRE